MVQPTPNVSLSNYSTMRLGGIADYLVDIHSANDLVAAVDWAHERHLPMIMIGGGSNIFWQDDGFRGLVMVNKIMGYQDAVQADCIHVLTVGSGEPWDSVVARSVQAGLTGIEALSFIPGTAGGTPIQNVGAYGQRISRVLISLEAYDTETHQIVTIAAKDCGFGYRDSRFKSADRGRFFITSITLKLKEGNPMPPYYIAVQDYLQRYPVEAPITPAVLRDVVIAIRTAKLPDPERVANNGSFFANPVVSETEAKRLEAAFPGIPCWPGDDGTYKIPAAWLIEQVGLKGYHDTETGMATWEKHALVLVNEHAKTTADLFTFKQKIVDTVQARFGITLVQEPELLPHANQN
ncbi:MAG TPA: UDP-N-acetylmuramate dehydrogenase [Candidatus Saccharimonadales bacterium]|nr:UDP-N-acetylmuramate dehydrogenase [Candidatus Saccharimonadales bacterium]